MIEVGDYVTDQWGERGMVSEEYENFFKIPFMTLDNKEWLEMQTVPFSNEELDEKWFMVICDTGGGIQSCESKLELVSKPDISELKNLL